MSSVRLDEVCEIIMGQSPSGTAYNNNGKGWGLIAGAGDFDNGKIAVKKFTTEASKISKPGDIVLGIRASIGEKVLSDGEYCLGRGVAGLRPKDPLDSRYLWHWLSKINPVLNSKSKGATFKQVNRQDIGELPIKLPTLTEQKRIAAILDKADALRATRREAIEKVNSLSQAIFLEMFGDPAKNSKNFYMHEIGSCLEVQGGFAFKSDDYVSSGVRLVKISNVHSGNLTWSDVSFVPMSYLKDYKNFELYEGDIVMALTRPIISSLTSVKIATVGADDTPSLLNQRVARFKFHNKPSVLPKYFLHFCKGTYFFNQVQRYASESLQPNISTKQIEKISILMPPIDLQKKFSERILKIEETLRDVSNAYSVSEKLFNSLQSQCFEVVGE